ncbi:hypothetical protein OG389_16455 [Streptomyces sp. NBC_00435]|uniref:maleate cis-trans isomerase family protein n=1 Tax=Streptomyces sp. NBC_00435 TaxID=2903649 RepID=UPI002E213694
MPQRPDSMLGLLSRYDGQAERTVRVGVLLPWANQVVESELPRLGLRHTVFHHARLVPASRTTAVDDSFWHGLRDAAGAAMDSMRHLPLDGTVLACTSAGFTGGPSLPPGVVTAFDALTATLTAVGASQVVLAAPYPQEVTDAEAGALEEAGIQVTARVCLGLADGYPEVMPGKIRTMLHQLPPEPIRDADVVVLSCTGWQTLNLLPELERDLGRPVLSSNVAMALHAARLAIGATL